MKITILFLICFVAFVTRAQTAIIAHKSHSGSSAYFFTDPSTNFGDPGPRLIQIVRLNDSTYVNVYSEFSSGFIYHDTVRHKIDYNLNIDSIKQPGYYNRVEYINFKDSPKDLKPKTPGYQLPEIESEKMIQNEAPVDQQPAPKKKKKSYLLFLFGITGGGMILMRLFSRSKINQQSIA